MGFYGRNDSTPRPAWIRSVEPKDAGGELGDVYREIGAGSGALAHILMVQSLHPGALRDHYTLYRRFMFGPSPLSRTLREAIAVAVSATNHCHY